MPSISPCTQKVLYAEAALDGSKMRRRLRGGYKNVRSRFATSLPFFSCCAIMMYRIIVSLPQHLYILAGMLDP